MKIKNLLCMLLFALMAATLIYSASPADKEETMAEPMLLENQGGNMNYIYFNEYGRLKKHTITDLFAGSNLADTIYIFSDFDVAAEDVYDVTLMFKRSDGAIIGEVDCLRELAVLNPATGTTMPAHSFVLGSDVLGVAGTLQITARYYSNFDVDGDGTLDQVIKATAMVVASVAETVPTFNENSTVLANINRKITHVEDDLTTHIAEYDIHDHDAAYYLKAAADALFAHELTIESGNIVKLKTGDGTVLSSITVAPTASSVPPGTLVFNGTGTYILDQTKTYCVMIVGSPNIYLDVFKKSINGGTGEITYTKMTVNMELFLTSMAFQSHLDEPVVHDPFDGTYYIAGDFHQDGGTDTFEGGWLDFGILNEYISVALGLNSIGYFQVYELDV